MQSVPANIQVKDMEERLLQHVPEVLSVHEFHVWQLGGDQIVGKWKSILADILLQNIAGHIAIQYYSQFGNSVSFWSL